MTGAENWFGHLTSTIKQTNYTIADTSCYHLHKNAPNETWYKKACSEVAKIFQCLAVNVVGEKSLKRKSLPGQCNNDVGTSSIKHLASVTLNPIRLW